MLSVSWTLEHWALAKFKRCNWSVLQDLESLRRKFSMHSVGIWNLESLSTVDRLGLDGFFVYPCTPTYFLSGPIRHVKLRREFLARFFHFSLQIHFRCYLLFASFYPLPLLNCLVQLYSLMLQFGSLVDWSVNYM